jgi:hypothetical protein
VPHSPAIRIGIPEAHILEDEALSDRLRHRQRILDVTNARPDGEEVEQVLELKTLLVAPGHRHEDVAD